MSEWNKYFITPQELHDNILKLADIIPKDKYKNLHSIPRGGLIIGTYLSHYLNLPLLIYNSWIHPKDTLIIDDLLDTGETLKHFSLQGFDIAVIYYKPRSIVKPTYYVEESPNDRWIVFPFEKPNEVPNRDV